MDNISRKEFIKRLSVAAAVTTGVASLVSSCKKRVKAPLSGQAEPSITGEMTYRVNHNTGDKVSLLGYGCMRWPTLSQNGKEVLDQEQINRLVDYALEHGVNYFDTSPVYCQGLSERATGIALSRHPRSSYYIATKLSNFNADEDGNWSLQTAKEMFNNSLQELQTDYIDYLLLHAVGGGGMDMLRKRFLDNGVLDYLLDLRKQGKIRNLGFSYHGDVEVFDYLVAHHNDYHWDFVQIQMNYKDWKHTKEINPRNTNAEYLYNALTDKNIPVVIMEPLLGGQLTKLPAYITNKLKARRPTDSVASWAFRFCGTYPNVLTTLSGMTYMEHLADNLHTHSPLQPLNDEELAFLESIAQDTLKYKTIPCTGCQYCMPCPYGLDIPSIFSYYNTCVNEGKLPTAATSQQADYHKLRREFLIEYDRRISKLRQADHCIGCHRCEQHCPQNISIAQEMGRIDNYVEELKINS